MNKGLTGAEIAEAKGPPELEQVWHTHGYHGPVGHSVKAIYQRYLGWFDGNPARLWEHPPRESAIRYVECLGGGAAVVAFTRRYLKENDLRFAAPLLNHAVFANEGNKEARDLLAEVYTRLGHGAENATWRNLYLTGALELSDGVVPAATDQAAPGLVAALGVDQILDSIAIRIDGPRAWNESLSIDWHLTDLGERYRTTLSNETACIQHADPPEGPVDLTLSRLTKAQLLGLLAGRGGAGRTERRHRRAAAPGGRTRPPDTRLRHRDRVEAVSRYGGTSSRRSRSTGPRPAPGPRPRQWRPRTVPASRSGRSSGTRRRGRCSGRLEAIRPMPTTPTPRPARSPRPFRAGAPGRSSRSS